MEDALQAWGSAECGEGTMEARQLTIIMSKISVAIKEVNNNNHKEERNNNDSNKNTANGVETKQFVL